MTDCMPRPRYPNVHTETHRGVVYWYYRQGHGPRFRLRGDYGSEQFVAAYEAAVRGERPAGSPSSARKGTLGWLVARYRDAAYGGAKKATIKQRENILRSVLETAAGSPLETVTKGAIAKGRDKRSATPAAANNFLKTMRALFKWAVASGLADSDPTEGVARVTYRTDGHPPWTPEDIAAFERKWPVGTRERLALVIFLCTGLRLGDAAALGRQHVRDGVIMLRTEKTGEVVTIPVLPDLQSTLDATPSAGLAFICKANGQPMVKEGFGNWFGEACRAAGVMKSAHGLRKAAATYAAENGATEAELEAIFGWRGGKMAAHYTKSASRVRLAKDAIDKLSRNRNPEREFCSGSATKK